MRLIGLAPTASLDPVMKALIALIVEAPAGGESSWEVDLVIESSSGGGVCKECAKWIFARDQIRGYYCYLEEISVP